MASSLGKYLVTALIALLGFAGFPALATAAVAAPVPAAVTSAYCNGQPATHIVKTYAVVPPFLPAPMRCGTSAYGYNHIKSRYDSDPLFDFLISNTLQYPSWMSATGTSETFQTYALTCGGGTYFRVVIEFARYADGKPKGLITAYYTNDPLPAADRVVSNPAVAPMC